MGYNDAVVIELSQVPCELICAICHELISDPLQTPCHHVFCGECILQSFDVNQICPIDRSQLTMRKLIPIQLANPILYRIWNKIKLRCPYAVPNVCHWTGSPETFEAHMSACACSQGSVISQESTGQSNSTREQDKLIFSLNNKIFSLNNKILPLNRDIAEHLTHIALQTDADQENRALYDTKVEENRLLNQQMKNIRVIAIPSYDYNIHTAAELSQLIFQDRESCPSGIDRNRVYQCITKIARVYHQCSWEAWEGFPEVKLNLHMLVAIASASSWFTSNQRSSLETERVQLILLK
mmetsp:Transcript_11053/g.10668  ORF Transcript_11053/g.10668 Transcript_11053/m.10668 type:complete len:296 (-) Transcript_11053:277-1164(-)